MTENYRIDSMYEEDDSGDEDGIEKSPLDQIIEEIRNENTGNYVDED